MICLYPGGNKMTGFFQNFQLLKPLIPLLFTSEVNSFYYYHSIPELNPPKLLSHVRPVEPKRVHGLWENLRKLLNLPGWMAGVPAYMKPKKDEKKDGKRRPRRS